MSDIMIFPLIISLATLAFCIFGIVSVLEDINNTLREIARRLSDEV